MSEKLNRPVKLESYDSIAFVLEVEQTSDLENQIKQSFPWSKE
jgi:hypothetical protein